MNDIKRSLYLAYFTSYFPGLSHTFIYKEVQDLRNLGIKIKTFSVHKPPINMTSEEARDLIHDTFYIFPINIFEFIWSHLYFLCKKPSKYLEILFFVLTRPNVNLKDRIRTLYHFCEAIYMAKRIERDNIKHIHVHFVAGCATSAMIISKLLGINFSFTAHGSALLLEKLLLKEKINSAKFIIAISKYNKNFILNIAPENIRKIFVVHCGVNPLLFFPCPKKTDTITILSVGRLVPEKGHSFLIEACNVLKENGFQFHCIIIGEGPDRQKLERLIYKYKLDNFIELKGPVFHEKIKDYYNLADIFVLSSVTEGIPVVLMESMSKEIPVIASRITGIPELIEHGKNGILIPPKDIKQLADAISLLIKNDDLRREIGKKGREKILKDFDIKKNIIKLKIIFESQIC